MLPEPIIEKHEGFLVVRDDLLAGGSKRRFIRPLIESSPKNEWVYASQSNGYAQISLAYVCRDLGKQATLFIPKCKELHPCSQAAEAAGAKLIQVPMGRLSNCTAKARAYVAERDAELAPFGFDCPLVLAEIERVAMLLPVFPTEVWSVVSSGTLTRGLQRAWPWANFYGVSIGHKPDDTQKGWAEVYEAPEDYAANAKYPPPFPSAVGYDAKVWRFIRAQAKPGALFWNVGK